MPKHLKCPEKVSRPLHSFLPKDGPSQRPNYRADYHFSIKDNPTAQSRSSSPIRRHNSSPRSRTSSPIRPHHPPQESRSSSPIRPHHPPPNSRSSSPIRPHHPPPDSRSSSPIRPHLPTTTNLLYSNINESVYEGFRTILSLETIFSSSKPNS